MVTTEGQSRLFHIKKRFFNRLRDPGDQDLDPFLIRYSAQMIQGYILNEMNHLYFLSSAKHLISKKHDFLLSR